jgi:dihydrofolate synthase/folylpolyglutamate synthase
VITNIGIDHTEFLGNTLAQIAEEKAGIMKPHVPCVVGETQSETQEVFLSRARVCDILGEGLETTDCRLWFADQCGYMRKRRLKEAPVCQLQGVYQDKNQQTAYVALQVLRNYYGVELSKEAIAKGFAHVCTLTGLRGRWEVLSQNPLTICDTGHNGHGLRYVAEQLSSLIASSPNSLSPHRLHIILGMVNDKDIDTVLSLLPTEAVYYFTQPATSRALPAEELLRRWQQLHPIANTQYPIANRQYPISAFSTVREALTAAQEAATAEDIIFIGGSNYVVGEVLSI